MGCIQSPGIRKKCLLFINATVKYPGDGKLSVDLVLIKL